MVRRELRVYAKWGHGVVEITVHGEALELVYSNARLTFEPRTMIFEAEYSSRKEVSDGRKRKLVVEFTKPLEPLEAKRVDIVGTASLGLFEVKLTDLEFHQYLTVITPGSFFYDYLVVSSTSFYAEMSARKKLFYEEEPFRKLIVYIV